MQDRAPVGSTIAAFAAGSTACGLVLAWRETRGESREAVLVALLFTGAWALLATAIFMSAVVLLAWGAERPVPRMVALKASIAGGFYFPLLTAIVMVLAIITERLRFPPSLMGATAVWTVLLGGLVLGTPAALAWCLFWRRRCDSAVEQTNKQRGFRGRD